MGSNKSGDITPTAGQSHKWGAFNVATQLLPSQGLQKKSNQNGYKSTAFSRALMCGNQCGNIILAFSLSPFISFIATWRAMNLAT